MAEVKEATEKPVEKKTPVKKVLTGHITDCKLLKIRDAATVDGCVLGLIDEKGTIKILDEKDPYFYKIQYGEIVGFCMKKYVEVNR